MKTLTVWFLKKYLLGKVNDALAKADADSCRIVAAQLRAGAEILADAAAAVDVKPGEKESTITADEAETCRTAVVAFIAQITR